MALSYYRNPSSGDTVVVVDEVPTTITRTLNKMIPGITTLPEVKKLLKTIPDYYIGRAKCSPEDVWDTEHGEHLARLRALAKLNRMEKKIVEKMYMILYSHYASKVFDHLGKLDRKETQYENDIEVFST